MSELYKITQQRRKKHGWKLVVCFVVLSLPGKEVKCSKRQLGLCSLSLPPNYAIAFASGRNASQNFMSWNMIRRRIKILNIMLLCSVNINTDK